MITWTAGKNSLKFLVVAGFLCDKANTAVAVIKGKIHLCLKIAEMLIKNEGAYVFHCFMSKQPNIGT